MKALETAKREPNNSVFIFARIEPVEKMGIIYFESIIYRYAYQLLSFDRYNARAWDSDS